VEVAATKTPCTPQELVEAIAAIWPTVVPGVELTPACACVLASQWGIETGEGASMICHNVGNAKANPATAPMWTQFTTQEYVNGVLKTISPPEPGCQFVAYPSLQAGVQAWLTSFARHWTVAWPYALAGDPMGFAIGLHNQKPPYYTGEPSSYAAGMKRYFDSYMETLKLPPMPPVPSSADPLADTDPPPPSPETD
jgi:hypothetical protein